ncbi:hypothetical protein TM1040_1396 [Ruegeria sp. TM1040]|nr:hypothetical protein TM1040_1396 [Ruegeria sp. TM1040]
MRIEQAIDPNTGLEAGAPGMTAQKKLRTGYETEKRRSDETRKMQAHDQHHDQSGRTESILQQCGLCVAQRGFELRDHLKTSSISV